VQTLDTRRVQEQLNKNLVGGQRKRESKEKQRTDRNLPKDTDIISKRGCEEQPQRTQGYLAKEGVFVNLRRSKFH
jgi:hypothetical protein